MARAPHHAQKRCGGKELPPPARQARASARRWRRSLTRAPALGGGSGGVPPVSRPRSRSPARSP
eukprot:6701456-Alexandrium_andersonii.AAC.1